MIENRGRILALVCSLLALIASPAGAVQVGDLYQAEVPVAGQEAAQRGQAISDAFRRVLVKVSGNPDIGSRSELSVEIANASRYVQQYRYRLLDADTMRPAETAAAGQPGVPAEPDRMLQVVFDSAAVNRMLRDLGLPVWGDNRPAGLVWIAVEQQGKRRLLNPDTEPGQIREALEAGAQARGLPILFPLMDLEDQANLQVADLWGDFENNIRNASDRYSPDLILTGKLVRIASGHWRAFWQLYQGDQVSNWEDQASDQSSLARAAVERMADMLAERFAPLGADFSMNRVRIRIEGVVDLQDYASLGRFLEAQSAIQKVDLIVVEPDAMTYDLHTRGSLQILQQELELGGMLAASEPASGVSLQTDQGIDLFFRLR